MDEAGKPVAEQRRRLALLALLATVGGQGMTRDKVVAFLWPESPAENARHALQQLVYYLRHEVATDIFLGTDPLRLNPEVVTTDVGDFDQALERGAIADAVALYRGPFLDGFFLEGSAEFERWVDGERSRLAGAYHSVLYQLAKRADEAPNHTAAIGWWRKLAEAEPLSGRAAVGLMRALAAGGDYAAALRHADAHVAVVRADLGGDVEPGVAALAAELRSADAPLPRAPASLPLAPGRHDDAGAAADERYRIHSELGRGGMATVYLAHDLRHDRPVALKVLHPELVSALGAERFLREIEVASNLQHPSILPLFDSGTIRLGGQPLPYYAMPFVEGESLASRLAREKQLELEDALQIAGDVAAALGYAHGRGVVHRDIKPENILLSGGRALVADFGIARAVTRAGRDRLTETGLALGTPAYMSPEQAAAGDLDGRADIYGLGCVLYEMLAGVPPFVGPTAQAVLARHAVDPVPSLRTLRPTVPPTVERAIERALAKVPADRFATAAQFVEALHAAPEPGAAATAAYAGTRHPAPMRKYLVAAAAVLVLGVGAAASLIRAPEPEIAPSANLVAVLPFRVRGADPTLGWLREGIIDLLAIKLTGDGGPRAAEPRAVLGAWHRLTDGEGGELSPDGALRVARSIGAGRLIDGGVVGTASHLTLSATVLSVPEGRRGAQASVEGPLDSLPALVDLLAVRLLSLQAGVNRDRLPQLTSSSLPAVRAYLAGRAAWRKGRWQEARRWYGEAIGHDSTFALAAMELAHVGESEEEVERANRLALEHRDRLGAAERAVLDVRLSQWITAPEMFSKWESAASAYPDRPEVWHGLGDAYWHWGPMSGLDSSLERADEAFRRGWSIDSSSASDSTVPEPAPVYAEWLSHMVEFAQLKGDTAEVRRLVGIGLAADSTTEQAGYLRWHLAVAEGDSARRAFWRANDINPGSYGWIAPFSGWTGIGIEEQERATAANLRQQDDPYLTAMIQRWSDLNAGRPRKALSSVDRPGEPVEAGLRRRVLDALYWDGDTSAAVAAAERLRPAAAKPLPADDAEAEEWLGNLCTIAQWDFARNQADSATEAIRKVRGSIAPPASAGRPGAFVRSATLCSATLDALDASARELPDLETRLERLDSLARTLIFHFGPVENVNLVLARLWEARNQPHRALAAVRRRAGGFGLSPGYLSTFFREEGRLAAEVGDTMGAIRAFRLYLDRRRNPEPSLEPEVQRVREQLALLVGDRGRK